MIVVVTGRRWNGMGLKGAGLYRVSFYGTGVLSKSESREKLSVEKIMGNLPL